MRFTILCLWCIVALLSSVQAQRTAVYRFENSFEEESGKLPKLKVLGQEGTFQNEKLPELKNLQRTVYVFDRNCGLQFDNRAANGFLSGSYTIEIYFRFTSLDSWKRVIDFKNRKSDNGCYIFYGKLNFYNFATGTKAPVNPNEYTHYVVARDARTNQLKMYVDGESKVEFTDRFSQGIIDEDGMLNFFFDDLIVKDEASDGAVAMIKLYDYVVDPASIKRDFQLLEEKISQPLVVNTPTPVAPQPVVSPPLPKEVPKENTPEPPKNYTSLDNKNVSVGKAIVLQNLRFAQSKPELLPESNAELENLFKFMQEHPTANIELQGHTDNRGDFDLNLALSRQRVEVVKAFLVKKGISPSRITGKGFGSSRPIANNNREETRQLNRRVELIITKL
ncbi:outer membrane protein OmpA-like peptidoglycan-associated protein [Runella defluvii]|uniref:Outer membrane protein OmpA-like peptidoglycan-associated protein n=1 Tax=Runella defluvii TaxID=370973 RepID=A0A7W5ZGT5_9BACT|nr:OmpA family protein [Runella defluvii]MBB3837067.1 outer membrane protein OmpA-like peptidoglycan-associated protein [Runella defluvii]